MLSRGTGWPHFAQICPAFTVRSLGFFARSPNNQFQNPTVPPISE